MLKRDTPKSRALSCRTEDIRVRIADRSSQCPHSARMGQHTLSSPACSSYPHSSPVVGLLRPAAREFEYARPGKGSSYGDRPTDGLSQGNLGSDMFVSIGTGTVS
jgi:hypothetical protein